MGLKLINGAPLMSRDAIVAMALRTTNENPIEYAEGSLRSQRISRDFPISRVRFMLRGDLNVTSTVTLDGNGLLNLISNLRISRNGNQDVVNVPGKALSTVHRMAKRNDPYEVLPTLTAGTTPFVAAFEVPLDVGGYLSLLDATGDKSLDVKVDWGRVGDIVASGAATLENVQLDIVPMVVDGALPGEPGGTGVKYFRQHMIYNDKPVTQAQPDFMFDLNSERGYNGFTLFAYEDDALSDGIVNSVTIERANANNITLDWDDIRAMNTDRFDLTGTQFTGVFDLPFVDDGHMEHSLSIRDSQSMRLILDVEHPGVTDSIGLLQSYFRNPAG